MFYLNVWTHGKGMLPVVAARVVVVTAANRQEWEGLEAFRIAGSGRTQPLRGARSRFFQTREEAEQALEDLLNRRAAEAQLYMD